MGRPKLNDEDKKRKIQPMVEGWRLDQLGGDNMVTLMCVEFIKKKTKKRIRTL
jgi:hypothetical protein